MAKDKDTFVEDLAERFREGKLKFDEAMGELGKGMADGKIELSQFQMAVKTLQGIEASKKNGVLGCKVSEKGCLTVRCGRGTRFGTSLYPTHWVDLMMGAPDIIQALYDNERKGLSFKDERLPDKKELVAGMIEGLKALVK